MSKVKVQKVKSIADLKAKISDPKITAAGVNAAVRQLSRVRPRTLAYKKTRYGRSDGDWADAIYDLSEISRAADTESLLSVSFRHHRELMLKEGFKIKGPDANALRILKQRISEIENISNRTFASIIRDVATDLIKFHTAFIFMRRDATRSSGGAIRMFGKRLEPIAALEPVDPTSMQVKQNKSGAIIQWRQYIPEQGEDVKFAPDEIICITMDKKTGFVFGTPFCLSVLDDILTLRRLEELVDVIATKFAFPLVHYKVGTEHSPAQEYQDENGGFYSEIDLVKDTLGDLPTEGSIVTSERHEIIVLGADGNVMNLQPYLEYFKARVMNGLRLSGVEVGQSDSTSKGSAITISKNMADAVKDYQEVLADAISFYLFRAILLEEGFDVGEANLVRLAFSPVDQEEQRAKENQAMALYQGHALTQDEMRDRMDMEAITDEEMKNTYLHMVEIPLAEAQGEIQRKASEAQANLTANKNRPANQSGKKATKTKVKKNDAKVSECWAYVRRLVAETDEDIRDAVRDGLNRIVGIKDSEWKALILESFTGVNSTVTDTFFKKIVKKECRAIENKISTMSLSFDSLSVLDGLENSVKRVFSGLDMKARAFGMLEAARENGTHVTIDGQIFTDLKSLSVALAHNEEE